MMRGGFINMLINFKVNFCFVIYVIGLRVIFY